MRLRFVRGLAVVIGIATVVMAAADQIWDREVLPGVTFRMERLEGMNLNVYGVKLSPDRVRMEPVLAGGRIYDSSATNGRSTVSQLVQENNAIGGINGDFFQFGQDPGGDPAGAMMRFGELLSVPRNGGRYASYGWGEGLPFQHVDLVWAGAVTLPSGRDVEIDDLYARVDADELVLTDSMAADVYCPEEYLVIRLSANEVGRSAKTKWSARVAEVSLATGRTAVFPGELVLAAHGVKAEALKDIQVGDVLSGSWELRGLSSDRVNHVMGGGPVLVRDGEAMQYPDEDGFATTKHPRSAVGMTASGEVWFLVADGRQTQSAGIGLNDLGALMKRWGCVQALNLDGGGSSAVNLLGLTLNKPSGGTERYVANGVVWLADRSAPGEPFQLAADVPTVVVGESVLVEARRRGRQISGEQVIWTAQGDGWIDQDGVLRGTKAGVVTVMALVDGRIERLTLKVVDGGK